MPCPLSRPSSTLPYSAEPHRPSRGSGLRFWTVPHCSRAPSLGHPSPRCLTGSPEPHPGLFSEAFPELPIRTSSGACGAYSVPSAAPQGPGLLASRPGSFPCASNFQDERWGFQSPALTSVKGLYHFMHWSSTTHLKQGFRCFKESLKSTAEIVFFAF